MTSSLGGYGGLKGNTGQLGMATPGSRGAGPGDVIPKGYRKGQLQQFTPEMMQLFSQLFSQVDPESYLSKLASGDQSLFGEMEAPAFRQFNELQGGLASRFSGMGMGARKSSGFQNASTAASSNFAQDLQSQRQALQRQAIMDLMGLSNQLLGQRPYENIITPKSKRRSFLEELFSSTVPAFAQGLGSSLGSGGGGGGGGIPMGG